MGMNSKNCQKKMEPRIFHSKDKILITKHRKHTMVVINVKAGTLLLRQRSLDRFFLFVNEILPLKLSLVDQTENS